MIDTIKAKIQQLKDEISSIEYTANVDNIDMTSFDERKVNDCKAKIQVLNEVIITHGIQDPVIQSLCTFQYWLGANYTSLPTDSGEMTRRARKYLKQQ